MHSTHMHACAPPCPLVTTTTPTPTPTPTATTAGGTATAALLSAGLGDATWSISSGIGALFAAAIFEVGQLLKEEPVGVLTFSNLSHSTTLNPTISTLNPTALNPKPYPTPSFLCNALRM